MLKIQETISYIAIIHQELVVSALLRLIINWKATIKYNSKNIHLGYYAKFEDAVKAREIAEKELGYTTKKEI